MAPCKISTAWKAKKKKKKAQIVLAYVQKLLISRCFEPLALEKAPRPEVESDLLVEQLGLILALCEGLILPFPTQPASCLCAPPAPALPHQDLTGLGLKPLAEG